MKRSVHGASTLPVQRAGELAAAPAQTPWLVEQLWGEQAVGILGGEPKCCKSFLALDIAVAVASAKPCLRRYPVGQAGPVLFFPAEDSLDIVRRRLDGIARAAGVNLSELPLHVITAPSLRLDLPTDRARLAATVQALEPVLLILDPLIRLHQLDENDASQIAPLLGFLRQLQRQFHLAVMVVHHAKKDGASLRPGQALRGSSELHGWGDSNLYLRRHRERLTLTVEHRAAPSLEPIDIRLTQEGSAVSLSLVDPSLRSTEDPPSRSPQERVLQALSGAPAPMTIQSLRQQCALRTATLCATLKSLCREGTVHHDSGGYRLRQGTQPTPTPKPCLHRARLSEADTEGVSQLHLPIGPAGNGNGKHSTPAGGANSFASSEDTALRGRNRSAD